MDPALRTGQVAARAGVHIQTLRFYERKGLIKEPPRRASGYREYPSDSVRLIRFIKDAQSAGFSLKEIRELLRLRDDGAASCVETLEVAERKIAEIDAKIRSLRSMRRTLAALVQACPRDESSACPILQSLGSFGRGER